MFVLKEWMVERGAVISSLIDSERETVCTMMSSQFAATFPSLCYDPTRFDAAAFQQLMFRKTPERYLTLIQAVLRFGSMNVLEREYRWIWGILPRYGVTQAHLLTLSRFAFEAMFDALPLEPRDCQGLEAMERAISGIVIRNTSSRSERGSRNNHNWQPRLNPAM